MSDGCNKERRWHLYDTLTDVPGKGSAVTILRQTPAMEPCAGVCMQTHHDSDSDYDCVTDACQGAPH
eukprot:1156780-Pelagomonas_calceolata.AAC.5